MRKCQRCRAYLLGAWFELDGVWCCERCALHYGCTCLKHTRKLAKALRAQQGERL